MKSLNIIFPERNKIEVVEEAIDSVKSDEVLCAADSSLISTGTELFCLGGVFDSGTNWERWVKYPFYPGYSMSANIIKIGDDVKDLKIGDRVVCWVPHKQYFVTKPKELYLIPEKIDSEEATWATLAVVTQIGIRFAQIELGESIGVIGLGILGQLVVQYLRVLGARNIFVFDLVGKRLDIAKKHGASYTFLGNLEGALHEIKKITKNKMLDAVFEMTGNSSVLSISTQFLRKLGRLILIGDSPTPSKQFLGSGVVSNGIRIIGAHGSIITEEATPFNHWTKEAQINLFFDYLIQKRMKVKDLITDRFSPLDAPIVYKNLLKDRSENMGVIFDWKLL